jgi:hypothetical protein
MDVQGGEGEIERPAQRAEDVQQRDRVRATRDGHQDDFAATEHPVAANGIPDAIDETGRDGHIR